MMAPTTEETAAVLQTMKEMEILANLEEMALLMIPEETIGRKMVKLRMNLNVFAGDARTSMDVLLSTSNQT